MSYYVDNPYGQPPKTKLIHLWRRFKHHFSFWVRSHLHKPRASKSSGEGWRTTWTLRDGWCWRYDGKHRSRKKFRRERLVSSPLFYSTIKGEPTVGITIRCEVYYR